MEEWAYWWARARIEVLSTSGSRDAAPVEQDDPFWVHYPWLEKAPAIKADGRSPPSFEEAPAIKADGRSPPPGLKLEGGSLPGEAAKYPGTYSLVVGKLVNGRPAYQSTSDATKWIAFSGDGWVGQPESLLGQKLGFLDLKDSAAASPDVSAKTWQVNAGGTAAWVEQPQLKCTVGRPPLSVAEKAAMEKAAIEKAAADKKNTKKVAAEKAAAEKAAAAKALQEAEDAQLSAAIAASLTVSEHPVARV